MIINGKEYEVRMNGKTYHCALDVTIDYIGGKWKSVVLWYLRSDVKRFSELRQHIPGITEKMLTLQLRELEKNGIITRKIYPVVPPKVEYGLTEFGRSLLPMLDEMAKWGRMLAETSGKIVEVATGEELKKSSSGELR